MLAREYGEKATAYIADPEKAAEVRRELEAHLAAAMEEAQGQGLDPESAELLAVGRMGAPETVAIQLGVTHHTHLPWRLYLAPVPLVGLFCLYQLPEVGPWLRLLMLGLVLWCLSPNWASLKRWGGFLYIDMVAKGAWLNRQPLRASLVAGGMAGLIFGGILPLLPMLPPWFFLFGPVPPLVAAGLLGLLVARCFHKGDWLMTGAFAALAFPVGSLPLLLNWRVPNPVAFWGTVTVVFALLAVAAGWALNSYKQRRLLASR